MIKHQYYFRVRFFLLILSFGILLPCLMFSSGLATASIITIDFQTYPDGTPIPGNTVITDQFSSQGVIFRGYDNPVFAGAVFFDARSKRGLTHSIVNPFPWGRNGIIAFFDTPISYLSVDIHAGRIGAIVNMELIDIDGYLIDTLSFSASNFYKGHFEQMLSEPIRQINWISSIPYDDRVGISSLSFQQIPEPTTLALMTLGLAGIGWKRRKAA